MEHNKQRPRSVVRRLVSPQPHQSHLWSYGGSTLTLFNKGVGGIPTVAA